MKITGIRGLNNERGSALVLVVLLTLILSAFSIVALRNIARSSQQAAVFLTRHQTQMTAGAATTAVSRRSGDKAANVYTRMKASLKGADDSSGPTYNDVLGGSLLGAGANDARLDTVRRGPYAIFKDSDFAFIYTDATKSYLFSPNPSTTENPLGPGAPRPSFEDQRASGFRVIVRDPIDAQAASGYSEDYCFKKVTIAAEATVGDSDDDWRGSNNTARSRNGMDGLIGPIECGY